MLVLAEIDHTDQSDAQNRTGWDTQVLEHFASCLNQLNQPVDRLAQIGRAEFAMILKAATEQDCIGLTQRLGALQHTRPAISAHQAPLRFTARIGAALVPTGSRSSVTGWIERALTQLYQSKVLGGTTVCMDLLPEVCVSADEKSMLFSGLGLDLVGDTSDHPLGVSEP